MVDWKGEEPELQPNYLSRTELDQLAQQDSAQYSTATHFANTAQAPIATPSQPSLSSAIARIAAIYLSEDDGDDQDDS